LTAIGDFLIGAFVGPLDDDEFTRGFVYFNCEEPCFIAELLPNSLIWPHLD